MGSQCLLGMEFQCCQVERVLEMDGRYSCTVGVRFRPRSHLQMVKLIILCSVQLATMKKQIRKHAHTHTHACKDACICSERERMGFKSVLWRKGREIGMESLPEALRMPAGKESGWAGGKSIRVVISAWGYNQSSVSN